MPAFSKCEKLYFIETQNANLLVSIGDILLTDPAIYSWSSLNHYRVDSLFAVLYFLAFFYYVNNKLFKLNLK